MNRINMYVYGIDDSKARGYAFAETEYVSVRTYLSKNSTRV